MFVATARALLRTGRADGERARRYEAERRARRVAEAAAARATLLQDLIAALARTMAAPEVGQVALRHAVTALDAMAGLVAVTSADGSQLELVDGAHLPDHARTRWQSTPLTDETPIAIAARTRKPVVLRTPEAIAQAMPELAADAPLDAGPTPAVLYAAPLLVDEGPDARVLGALLLLWDVDGAPGPSEMALLGTVADQCAQALERARLYAAERAARAEAEEASSAKTQLLSMMSHELRTPLNSIIGHLDLLDADVYGPLSDAQREAMARAGRSAVYLSSLINDLLNFARLTSGHVEYETERVPLGGARGVLSDIRALVAVQAAARGVTIQEDAVDGSLVLLADAEKVRMIVVNLVTNAIKFTEPGGTIALSCTADPAGPGAMVHLRVADTGRGIAADQFERVFEAFVQVNRHHSQGSQQGVGLGLAISRQLARAMGGELQLESTLGIGSTFTLSLPRA